MENCEFTGPYVVLPTHILEDNTLSDSEKILFAEISGLCHKEGYCFASNEYLAQRHHCTKITISRWISKLVNRGYLISKIVNNNQRRLYLSEVYHRNQWGLSQMIRGVITNDKGGVITNDKHNNKEYNSKTNIKTNKKEIYKESSNLPKKRQKDYSDVIIVGERLMTKWNDKFAHSLTVKPISRLSDRRIKGIKARLEDGYTPEDLERAIDMASTSQWCTSGRWGFGFDWIYCCKDNILKLLEGTYNNKTGNDVVNDIVAATYSDPAFAELYGKENKTPQQPNTNTINRNNITKLEEMKRKALGEKYD